MPTPLSTHTRMHAYPLGTRCSQTCMHAASNFRACTRVRADDLFATRQQFGKMIRENNANKGQCGSGSARLPCHTIMTGQSLATAKIQELEEKCSAQQVVDRPRCRECHTSHTHSQNLTHSCKQIHRAFRSKFTLWKICNLARWRPCACGAEWCVHGPSHPLRMHTHPACLTSNSRAPIPIVLRPPFPALTQRKVVRHSPQKAKKKGVK